MVSWGIVAWAYRTSDRRLYGSPRPERKQRAEVPFLR